MCNSEVYLDQMLGIHVLYNVYGEKAEDVVYRKSNFLVVPCRLYISACTCLGSVITTKKQSFTPRVTT